MSGNTDLSTNTTEEPHAAVSVASLTESDLRDTWPR
jgi:hypothetical protein